MTNTFEGTFAATCATIVSGAIAERCHFNGYIIFSTVMTGLLYPIPVHWCWAEGGWLRELGFSTGVANPCMLLNKARNLQLIYHVDDMLVAGEAKDLDCFY